MLHENPFAEDLDLRDFSDRNAGDKSVYAKFYVRPVLDETASVTEGRPIYHDREYVEIIAAGNSTNVVKRPVTDMDRQRFAAQYAKFRQGDLEQVIGTRLAEVPWVTRSQVEELAYLKIFTLEQLSEVADTVCTRVPGLMTLRSRAKEVLVRAQSAAPFQALAKENEELRAELSALKQAVKEQGELLKKKE